MKISLRTKIMFALVVVGLVPSLIMGWINVKANQTLTQATGSQFQSNAETISDMVDRNLFERYGDVQAFGFNEVVLERDSWHRVGSEKNKIAAAMNSYVISYGFYAITLLVDLEGKVIAVNDKDSAGNPIDTTFIYQNNFASAGWFKDVLGKNFYTYDGGLTGTVVEDLYADELVSQIYKDEGYVLGFSAPVMDHDGQVVAIWKNYAKFSLVEDIVKNSYASITKQGLKSLQITILNNEGNVIVDYDPVKTGNLDVVRNRQIIGRENLLSRGLLSAKNAVSGGQGSLREYNPLRKENQYSGYAHFVGALGFKGMPWAALVRVNESEALAAVYQSERIMKLVLAVAVIAIFLIAYFFSKSLMLSFSRTLAQLRTSSSEIRAFSDQLSESSGNLAATSSEQAASLEESAASLEEISAMSNQNSDNSSEAQLLTDEVKTAADESADNMAKMNEAVLAIRRSSEETAQILKTIDDIAFQTNLLALNAAVEAARAGDAGQGFAVVAEAVRALAMRSADAARETGVKLHRSRELAEEGVTMSGVVNTSLLKIKECSNKAAALVSQIAEATQAQSKGIDQINTSVAQLDKLTQSNAASAEESAAHAEHLLSQANALNKIVVIVQDLVFGKGSRQAENREHVGSDDEGVKSLARDEESRAGHAFH